MRLRAILERVFFPNRYAVRMRLRPLLEQAARSAHVELWEVRTAGRRCLGDVAREARARLGRHGVRVPPGV